MRDRAQSALLQPLGVTGYGPKHAVLFLIDDLGYSDTNHMGADFETPEIDRLALGGIRLNQSYASMVCSPSRASLLTSRYAYNIGMDGNVLELGDARCLPAGITTMGHQMQQNGVRTAFIGKWDVGYSSWACTPNCQGFDYFLGYYGPYSDYYTREAKPRALYEDGLRQNSTFDMHENYDIVSFPGEYSTDLFFRKAITWIRNQTADGASPSTFLQIATQAVHGPITAPPGVWDGCSHIVESQQRTYCAMVQAVDAGIGNLTREYERLGLFDDTVFLFLSDNGGDPSKAGFNVPLRGGKGTFWEGGIRSQTFVFWAGFPSTRKGSVFSGLAHMVDWGITLTAALGGTRMIHQGEVPIDGVNLWPALVQGGPSPRTEMLLGLRERGYCPIAGCTHPGSSAYRWRSWKLLWGHPSDQGGRLGPRDPDGEDECRWTDGAHDVQGGKTLSCRNGWAKPFAAGESRPPAQVPWRAERPDGAGSFYSWGGVLLFNIDEDPLEERDRSQERPDVVDQLTKKLLAYNATNVDQGELRDEATVQVACVSPNSEQQLLAHCQSALCGHLGRSWAVPWLPNADGERCGPPM
jgi:arylsulfatase A-like enzyme